MSIRIALVGAGVMGADHARIITDDLSGVALQVVCDASEERARNVAAEFGAFDMATNSMVVVARKDVDAVLIASPDETHAGLTLAAIEAGKPVLCEKPLATSALDCLKIVDAEVRSNHQFVQVGFMRRFDPSYTELKAVLAAGRLGRALMMHNFHRNVEAPASFTGQMAITNSAPHEFDAARFVLETEFAAISAFQPSSQYHKKTGAPVFMVLESADGQLVNIEVNNNAGYGYDVRGELVAENGSVFLNAPVNTRVSIDLKSIESYASDWRPRFAEAYRLQNKAWINAIKTGVPSRTAANAWDGYCATLVAEAGIEALETGRKVAVEHRERPRLYSSKTI